METIGSRIRKLRKNLKMRQSDVGKAVGVSSSAVVQWESGETHPTGKNLIVLAAVLGTTPAELVTGKPSHMELSFLRPDQIALLDAYESSSQDIQRAARRMFGIPAAPGTQDPGKTAESS